MQIEKEQLELNQRFIDLTYEFMEEEDIGYDIDPKALMKWLWNKGYCLQKHN